MNKLMEFLMPYAAKLTELGFGIYWTLPFGNDGRGTKVYLWPFVAGALILVAAVAVDKII